MINGIQWDRLCSRTGQTLENIAKIIYPGADNPLKVFLNARRSGTLLDEMDIAKLCTALRVTPNELLGYENISSKSGDVIEMSVEDYKVILDRFTGEVRMYDRNGIILSEVLILDDKVLELSPYLSDLVMIARHNEKYVRL